MSLLVLLAVIVFAVALRARLNRIERRIVSLEANLAELWRSHLTGAPAQPLETPPARQQAFVEDAPPEQATAEAVEPAAPPPPPAAPPLSPAAPSSPLSLEREIGTRWVVWLGGLALALGGLLLVRYAIEAGFFGPGMRVISGLIFAAALLCAGEWLRRREIADSQTTPTPAVLTAAGTVAGFGAIYAAHALYGFIGPATAFVALGAAALATLAAALAHGPWIAGLGLAGALGAPLLVQSPTPSPWPLLVFVGIAVAGSHALAILRKWAWLALAALGGAALWGLAMAMGTPPEFPAAACLHMTLHLALALRVFVFDARGVAADEAGRQRLALLGPLMLALAGVLVLAACGSRVAFFPWWIFHAAALVGLLAFGGARRPLIAPGLAPAAVAALSMLLLVWPEADGSLLDAAEPEAPGRFAAFAAVMGVGVFLLAARTLWRREATPRAASLRLGAAAALAPLASLIVAWIRLDQAQASPAFSLAALLAAALFLGFAALLRQRDREASQDRLTLGLMASACLAALALGLTVALDRGALTVALALSALGAAWVEAKLDIPALRACVQALGAAIALRLLWDPRIAGDALSTTPVFNWLLFGYGVPAASFALASRLLARHGDDSPRQSAEILAVLFFGLLAFFEIRHAMTGGQIFSPPAGCVEIGMHTLTALGFSAVLARLDAAQGRRVFRVFSLVFAVVSAALAAFGLCLGENPLFSQAGVPGGALLNGLLLGYALPAAAAALLANVSIGLRPPWFVRLLRIEALALGLLYVSLETRRLFQGEIVFMGLPTGQAETYAYSAVWLVSGVALLIYGLWRQSLEARVASAAVILLVALKVFFLDLAHLTGALRAFSFIGLGAVLIGIGLIYQKLVFRRDREAP